MLRVIYHRVTISIQRCFGIDANYFLKGGFYSGLQQAVGLISGLILAYLFGHFASKAVFGEYNLVLSIVSIVTIVSMPGLNVSLLRSAGQGFDGSLARTVMARLIWSLLGIPILIVWAFYYRLENSSALALTLAITAVLFPLISPFQSTTYFFIAKKRFDLQAWFTALSSVMTIGFIALAIFMNWGLVGIMTGYWLGQIVPALISLRGCQKLIKIRKKLDPDLLPYGYFLTGLQILPTIVAHISSILLAGMLGIEALAIYSVAAKFPGIVQKNYDVFSKPITAKLAGQSTKQHRATLTHHAGKFLLLSLVMFAGLWLSLPGLVTWFYGQQYLEAIKFSRLYSWSILPLPFIWLFDDMVTFQKRRVVKFMLSTVIPLVKLGAYLWVIPRWQITGLIIVLLIERLLTLVITGTAIVFGASPQKNYLRKLSR